MIGETRDQVMSLMFVGLTKTISTGVMLINTKYVDNRLSNVVGQGEEPGTLP